jgi:lipopolysaccharide export system protein LptA
VTTAGDSSPTTPPGPATPAPRRAEVTIKRPVIRHTEGGRLAWQVRLKELQVSAGAEAVAAAGMQGVIHDKTGLPAIRLTAQQAQGNTANGNLEVSGDVRATSPKGALITTDRVRWLEQERRLYCPGLVTMRTRNAALTTSGLSYFVDSDTVKAPALVRVYSGRNKLIGRQLVYDVRTEAFQMKKVQAVFNPRDVGQTPNAPR